MSKIRGVSNSSYKLVTSFELATYRVRFSARQNGWLVLQETQITLSPEFKRILKKGRINNE